MLSKNCLQCEKIFPKGSTVSLKEWNNQSKFCSRVCYGEARKGGAKYPAYWKGKSIPEKTREQISLTCKIKGIKPKIRSIRRGAENNKWKGGITPLNHVIRTSAEYESWRKAVFKRDDYTCQECGQYGRQLNADHIKPFATYPEYRFDIENGRTLCASCHRKTPTWGVNSVRYAKV